MSLGVLDEGSYSVIFTSWFGDGGFGPCSAFSSFSSDTIYFDVADTSSVGIPNPTAIGFSELNFYPNPVADFLKIENSDAVFLELTSVDGSNTAIIEGENGRFLLPAYLSSGLYQATVRKANGDILARKRIVIVR